MTSTFTTTNDKGTILINQREIFFQAILFSTILIETALLWEHLQHRLLLSMLLGHFILSGGAILYIHTTRQDSINSHTQPSKPLQTILLLLALQWGCFICFFPLSDLQSLTVHTLFLAAVLFFFLLYLNTLPLMAITAFTLLVTPILFILFSEHSSSYSPLARGVLSFSFLTGIFFYNSRQIFTPAGPQSRTSAKSSPTSQVNDGKDFIENELLSTTSTLNDLKTILQQINQQTTTKKLARNEAIWDAILTITDQSHLQNSWQNCFSGKLSSLCQPLEADRIYIVEASSVTQPHPSFQATADHSWIFSSPACTTLLRKGHIIHNQSPAINQDEKNALRAVGVQAFVDIPILLKNDLWGIIGMDRLTHSTAFTPQQIKGLHFIANILAMTVRNQQDRSERDRLATVIEQSRDCILITDSTGLILYANPACENVTGYTPQEVTGKTLKTLYPDASMDAYTWNQVSNAMQQGEAWQAQFTAHRKDRTLYEEEFLLSPARDQDGGIRNQVIIKRNITEKKRLESIAEAANLMDNIGFIFSSIRHELGNPINSIKVSLSVLASNLESYDTSDIKRFISRSLSDIGRVEYLLKTLKNFSTFERPIIEKTDFTALLNKFITLIAPELKQKNIRLATTIPQTPLFGLVDPRAFQQVLLNLIANAADALAETPQKNISLSIFKEENGQINIIIRDNGCGINDAEQANLFKPFFTTKTQGTGLGLVIVKKMLSKMNCSIDIHSKAKMGTRIMIVIPGI